MIIRPIPRWADIFISSSVTSLFLARLSVDSRSIVTVSMSYLIDDGVWGQTGAVEAEALVGDVMSRPLAQDVYLRQNVNILGIVPQVRKLMKM